MSFSIFSFMMSVLFSSAFILVIHFLRNRVFFLQSFGMHTVLAIYGICFIRMALVLEIPFAVPIGLRGVYSSVYAKVREAQVSVGNSTVELMDILCIVWFAVAGFLLLRFLWTSIETSRVMKPYWKSRTVAAERTLEKVKKGSKRVLPVSACICPDIDVPMGAGLIHKYIYLPDEEYAEEELYYILKHEYTHFCDRDLEIKFLVKLFCCVFWWNPAVYLLKKDVAQILEIKCDINATQGFTKKERLAYLMTIVRILKGGDTTKPLFPTMLATGLFSRKNQDDIKERFVLITKAGNPVPAWCQVAFWGLTIAIVLFSYSFVFQSAYDPPLEEIYTDSTVQEWELSDIYLIQHSDQSFSIVFGNGEMYSVNDCDILQMYITSGVEVRKE